MALPQTHLSFASTAVDALTWWGAGFLAMALVGLYLTFIGWAPAPTRTAAQPARPASDVPRAA